jgi:hypothetical protein
MDAARWAGKNAAANVTMAMPTSATRIVRGALELKPYNIERKVVATARDAGIGNCAIVCADRVLAKDSYPHCSVFFRVEDPCDISKRCYDLQHFAAGKDHFPSA